jgi:hypothetical protein
MQDQLNENIILEANMAATVPKRNGKTNRRGVHFNGFPTVRSLVRTRFHSSVGDVTNP